MECYGYWYGHYLGYPNDYYYPYYYHDYANNYWWDPSQTYEESYSAYIDYLIDYGGYWMYTGDKPLGVDDWYPVRPGSYYRTYWYSYPDSWRWVEFQPDYIGKGSEEDIIYLFGSVSHHGDHKYGGFTSTQDGVYDAVRIEDFDDPAEIPIDSGEDEYLGFGAYSQNDLGIGDDLLGQRKVELDEGRLQSSASCNSLEIRTVSAVVIGALFLRFCKHSLHYSSSMIKIVLVLFAGLWAKHNTP